MIVQIITSIIIAGIAILFLNPGHLTMPDSMVSMLIVGLIIGFLTFAAYLLKEHPRDERESFHALSAGRASYLVGVGALILGIIFQAQQHNIDPWLVIALCVMVFTKLLSRIYSHFKM